MTEPSTALHVIWRLQFAQMYLRLNAQGELRVGPREQNEYHWNLKQDVSDRKDELTTLMQDSRVANAFTDATVPEPEMERLIHQYITTHCDEDKKGFITEFTLGHVLLYHLREHGGTFPTRAQLQAVMDSRFERGFTLMDVVSWVGISLKPESVVVPHYAPQPKTRPAVKRLTRLELATLGNPLD